MVIFGYKIFLDEFGEADCTYNGHPGRRFGAAWQCTTYLCVIRFFAFVAEGRIFMSAHAGKGGKMEQRIGVVAIVVTDKTAVPQVQSVLTVHGDIISGRMGIPDHETGKNVIALIVKGTVEQISALSGALGRLNGGSAKSLLSKEE